MTENNRRINEFCEFCAAIAKEKNPGAILRLTAELNHILAKKFKDATVPSDPPAKAS